MNVTDLVTADRVAALLADLLADRTVEVRGYPGKGCGMYIGYLFHYNGGKDLFSIDYDDGDSSGEIGLAEVMQYLNTAIEFGCLIEVDQPMPEPEEEPKELPKFEPVKLPKFEPVKMMKPFVE